MWSVKHVKSFLKQNQLQELCSVFEKEGIDGQVLMLMNECDLKQIGITKMGHRKRVMRAIIKLHNAQVAQQPPQQENSGIEKKKENVKRQSTCVSALIL